jgi:hypothetical protein
MRGRPFKKGEGGRRPGSRNRATLLVENLLNGEAEQLGRAAIALALAGDPTGLKLCLDRVSPVRRGRPTPFRLPAITTLADLPKASQGLLEAVADGTLTATEAGDLSKVLDSHLRALELTDIESRLRALEAAKEQNHERE